jgi:hypothetical protein
MSELYNTIPPERREAYLDNARQAFHEATDPTLAPAIADMGHLIVEDATRFTRTHADAIAGIHKDADTLAAAPRVVDEAERYVQENDMTGHFRQELLEAPDAASIIEGNSPPKASSSFEGIGFGALVSSHQRQSAESRAADLNLGLADRMQEEPLDSEKGPKPKQEK